MSTTPAKNYSPVSLTLVKHAFAGVIDTGEACHRCQWHRWHHASPVSLIPGSKYRQLRRCHWQRQCMHCRCRWHRWFTSTTFGSSPMPLKEQSVKKQAFSGYYFSIASIKSSKESSNYDQIVCFASVNDTGEAPEKSNIFVNIRKKSKSLLGLSTGARRSCLKKKTRGEKSGGTVPWNWSMLCWNGSKAAVKVNRIRRNLRRLWWK